MTDTKFYIVSDNGLKYLSRNDNTGMTDVIDYEISVTENNIFFDVANINKELYTVIPFNTYGFQTDHNKIDNPIVFCLTDDFLDKNNIYLIRDEDSISDVVMDNLGKIYDLYNDEIKASNFQATLEDITILTTNDELKEYFLDSLGIAYTHLSNDRKSILFHTLDYETIVLTMKNHNYNIIDTDNAWLVVNQR